MYIGGYKIEEESEYSANPISEYEIVLTMAKFGLVPTKKTAKTFEEQNYTERDLMRHIRCELQDKYNEQEQR